MMNYDSIQDINLNISTIDIRKFIVIPPETKPELIDILRKEVENAGFEINSISGLKTHFTLDKFKTPIEEAEKIIEELDNSKEEIKKINLKSLEDEKGNIKLDQKLSGLISSFIVNTNKSFNPDKEKVLSIMKNILLDLYTHDIKGIEFLDFETLDYLVEAAISKKLEDAQINLDTALVMMLIQIRKISLLWLYDAISLNYYNLNVPKDEINKIQNQEKLSLYGKQYEVIPFTYHNNPILLKKTDLLFSPSDKTLVTINTGKHNQDIIIPLMLSIFIDKASFDWRIEYCNIITTAIARSVREISYQLKILELDFSKFEVPKIKDELQILQNGLDFLRDTLIGIKNQVESENKVIRRHYSTNYPRDLSRFLGGAISSSIRENSPLNSLNMLDGPLIKLDSSVEEISNLRVRITNTFFKLIDAKEQNDKVYFDAIRDEIGRDMKKITNVNFYGDQSRYYDSSVDNSINIVGDFKDKLENLKNLVDKHYDKADKNKLLQTIDEMKNNCNDSTKKKFLKEKIEWIITKTSEVASISSFAISLLQTLK